MKRKRLVFLLVAVALCAGGQLAIQAQTTRIDLAKSGNDVQVTMSDTSGPWRVVRSTSPQFNYQAVLLATAASSNPVTDANAALAPTLYFYDASDEGVGEVPADQGQSTQENLYLTSLSPNSGWEGQSITVNGSGFSSEPTENQVFFGTIQAAVTGATTTALTVTVPVGVMTGPVLVQVSALTSNSLPFTAAMESTYLGNAFQNISSIVFNDRTADATSSNHLFFSDMGTGATSDYLYEVMDDYSLTQRTFWNEMKGLAMDPSGNLYFANTTFASNTGLIKKYDAVSHAVTTYTNAKLNGEANSVSVVGVAYRPDGVIFAANRYDNTIRSRVPANPGAAIFVSGYTLDLYMGMAMDSANTLYFTSGGTLYKTPTSGAASVSTVATGFTNASGIAIDESTGNTLILIADRGAGSVYLLNAQTGLKDLVTSGLTSPRAVAFGKDKVTGELYYYVAEATRVLRLPDPKIKLDSKVARGNVKVLISRKGPGGAGDEWPCSLQSHDAQITVPFDVQGEINNATTVYVRLYDPKDPSAYVAGTANDNHDPAKTGASDPAFQSCLSATSFPVDANSRHGEVTLTITNQYAGDNYQVGFSFNSAILADASIKPAAKTGVLTAWKRVYIERDKMFQQGGLLKENAPSSPTNVIYLWKDPTGIQPSLPVCSNPPTSCGYSITLFDADHPDVTSGAQTANVINVADDLPNTQLVMTLDRAVTAPPNPTSFQASPQDFSAGRCAGVAVTGSNYYQADQGYQRNVFNDSFVEFITDNSSTPLIPFISPVPSNLYGPYFADLGKVWFTKAGTDNHFHLMGLSINSYSPALFGLTTRPTSGGHDYLGSGIFVSSIAAAVLPGSGLCMQGTGADTTVNQDVTNHECAHEFHVDRNGTGEHCASNSYKGGKCLEHGTYCPAVDTSRHLDADSASTASTHGGDVFDVRYEADGLPMNFQDAEDDMHPLAILAGATLLCASSAQSQVSLQLLSPGGAADHQPVLAVYLVATNLTEHPVMLFRDAHALNTDGWNLDITCDGTKMEPDPIYAGFVAPSPCEWLSSQSIVLSPKESKWIPLSLAYFLDYSASHSCKVTLRYEPPQPSAECAEQIKSQYGLPLEYLASKPLTTSLSFYNQVTSDDKRLVADYLSWKAMDKRPGTSGQKTSLNQLEQYLRNGGAVTAYPNASAATLELMRRIQNGMDHYGGRFSANSASLRYLSQNRAEYGTRAKIEPGREQGLLDLLDQCRFLLKSQPNLEPVCTWARLNLGGLLYISGDTPGAREQLEIVAKGHPNWDEGRVAQQMLDVISSSSQQQAPAAK